MAMTLREQSQSGAVLSRGPAEELAQGLGVFSLALGLGEIVAPGALARWLGMKGTEPVLVGYGAREIGAGVGILAAKNKAPWVWGRVAGDALDIATLLAGLGGNNRKKGNVLLALGAVVGVTVLDIVCAQALSAQQEGRGHHRHDYSDRRGFPAPPGVLRGAGRDVPIPRDMRAPEAMRPYGSE